MEYEFCSKQFQDLMAVKASIQATLQKKPKDIQLEANLQKVKHDMAQLTPIIQATGGHVINHLEESYGVNFMFLKNTNEPTNKQKRDSALKIHK